MTEEREAITTTERMQRLTESLSAQAIHLLAVGCFTEASRVWGSALLQLLPHLQDLNVTDDLMGPFSSGRLSMRTVDVTPSIVLSGDERIFSVFGRSIVYLATNPSQQQAWSLDHYRKVAAATVYNLALTHHLQGLQGFDNRQDLQKALNAYRSARDLLSIDAMDTFAAPDDVKLLLLAITNNEGHIREQSFEMREVQQCLHLLHSVLQHTWWVAEFKHFHETAVLFPSMTGLTLHAPVA